MNVLLTNDDGINAPGLRALWSALKKAGHTVWAVAPMRQQSGVGQSLTVFDPLRVCEIEDGDFRGTGVHGTPVDCVKLALAELLPHKPDLVMAGINQGQNAGPDIFYSGTVAAAAEAAHAGLPSMAVSHAPHVRTPYMPAVAEHAVALAGRIRWGDIAPHRVINVNYPATDPAMWLGPKICPQSPAVWGNSYSRHQDPRGLPYWWLMGEIDASTVGIHSDRGLLQAGYITMTPLKFEYTDEASLAVLGKMGLEG